MPIELPWQLVDKNFRFYLVSDTEKRPIEDSWNKRKCYPFDAHKFEHYISMDGNYGVVCGYGNLVVLDFDDLECYTKVRSLLPETFTVLSAGRRLPHLYYILEGSMIRKTPVTNGQGTTLCDIQGAGAGVIGPHSSYNGRFYEVVHDIEIRPITLSQLNNAFSGYGKTVGQRKQYTSTKPDRIQVDKVDHTISVLMKHGFERVRERHFRCPFHEMHGKGNLFVSDDGSLFCYHEWDRFQLSYFLHKSGKVRWNGRVRK
jgi:hypothetical protein